MGNYFHTKRMHNQLRSNFYQQYLGWIVSKRRKQQIKKQIKKLSNLGQSKTWDLKGTVLSFIEKQQKNLSHFINAKKLALQNEFPGGLASIQQMNSQDINQLLEINILSGQFHQIRRQVEFTYRQRHQKLKEKLLKIEIQSSAESQQDIRFEQFKIIQEKIQEYNQKILKQEAALLYEKQIDCEVEKIKIEVRRKVDWRSQLKSTSRFNSQIQKKVDMIVRKALIQIDINAKKLVGGYFNSQLSD